MACGSVDSDFVFRLFTKGSDDPVTLILDLRPYKYFKRSHVSQAFCVRMSSNGKALMDYSKAKYKTKWSQGVWWGKCILAYGDPDLKKSHPVIEFLVKEGQCKEINYHKAGFPELEKLYPFLCGPSVKANSAKSYPSQIVPRLLYLGDLGNANDLERLVELNIKSVVTIHNHPERTTFPGEYKHLRIELPDIETADISQHFNSVYKVIEEARSAETAVLVHCGAGVSRSATLCIAYLMRQNLWSLAKAHEHCKERRSRISVNEGFWRALSALQLELHITDRLDPNINEKSTYRVGKISDDAAGEKVSIKFEKTGNGHKESCGHPNKKTDERDRQSPGSRRKDRSRSRHKPEQSFEEEKYHRHTSKRSREKSGVVSSDHSPAKQRRKSHTSSHKNDSQEGSSPVNQDNKKILSDSCVALEVIKEGKIVGRLEIGELKKHGRCVVGRSHECDVKLAHQSISRQHAQFGIDGHGALSIMDLSSGHGTNVDGTWLRSRTPKTLKVGSVIRFGASTRSYKDLRDSIREEACSKLLKGHGKWDSNTLIN